MGVVWAQSALPEPNQPQLQCRSPWLTAAVLCEADVRPWPRATAFHALIHSVTALHRLRSDRGDAGGGGRCGACGTPAPHGPPLPLCAAGVA